MASKDLAGDETGVWVEVRPGPVDPQPVLSHAAAPDCGAIVLFLGTVRDHSEGKEAVTHLEYEAYGGVVEDKIREVVAEALDRWPARKIAAVHATGELEVGEVSVAVAAASPHRPDAFEAARYVIDELKRRAPIWKKEHWPGGAEWVREDHEHG